MDELLLCLQQENISKACCVGLVLKTVLYVDSVCIKARKFEKCTGAWKIHIGEIDTDMNLMEFSLSTLS